MFLALVLNFFNLCLANVHTVLFSLHTKSLVTSDIYKIVRSLRVYTFLMDHGVEAVH